MGLVLLGVLTWSVAALGIGTLLRLDPPDPLRIPVLGFAGIAALGVAATLVNFFAPVTPAVDTVLFVVGVGAFARNARFTVGARPILGIAAFVVGAAIVALFTAPVHRQYDTGLYHLQVVRWFTSESLTRGLANLHLRLGYNSAWLAAAATMEHVLLVGRSQAVLNGIALMFGASAAWGALRAIWRGDRSFSTALLLAAGPLAAAGLVSLGGLYSDRGAALLALVSLAATARALEDPANRRTVAPAAALIAAFAFATRIFYAPALVAAVVPLARAARAREWRTCLVSGGMVAAVLVPWTVRGVALSGCALFPAAISCIDALPWRVSLARAAEQMRWDRSWARMPGASPDEALTADWFGPWLAAQADAPEMRGLAAVLAIGILLLAVRRWAPTAAAAVIWLAAAVGAAAWFAVAPDPRFGLGFLYAFACAPFAIALSRTERPRVARWAIAAAAAASLAIGWAALPEQLPRLERTSPSVIPVVPWRALTTDSGLQVIVPVMGDQCWAAPLPCTPYFDRKLRWEDGAFVASGSGEPPRGRRRTTPHSTRSRRGPRRCGSPPPP